VREVSVETIPLEVLFDEPHVLASNECEHRRGEIVRQGAYVIVRHSAVHDIDAMLPVRAWMFTSEEELELTVGQLMGAFDAP